VDFVLSSFLLNAGDRLRAAMSEIDQGQRRTIAIPKASSEEAPDQICRNGDWRNGCTSRFRIACLSAGNPRPRTEAHMDAISKWAQFLGRVALGTIFLFSGAGKLAAWQGTVAYAASKGVPQILLVIATVLELVGGIGVVLGFKARWAAVALVVFLVPVTLVFHNFWAAPANEQQVQIVNFLKNLSIAGGALIVFARGAGAFSIDAMGARARIDPLRTAAARS
jgi:putative oxidoreductase